MIILLFFFNDTATTEIYTLSLHDALPICAGNPATCRPQPDWGIGDLCHRGDCAGCPGCDVETVAGGRFEGGVALGRQSGAAGRGLRHSLYPVLSGFRGDYVPVFHEGLLPRCASTGCETRPLVLGDPKPEA